MRLLLLGVFSFYQYFAPPELLIVVNRIFHSFIFSFFTAGHWPIPQDNSFPLLQDLHVQKYPVLSCGL